MGYFTYKNVYGFARPPLKFAEGVRCNEQGFFKSTHVSANSNGKKVVPAGTFVAEVIKNDGTVEDRPLPRGQVKTAATTSDTVLEFQQATQNFIAGDELYLTHPYATLTVTGTGLGSISYQGATYSFTPVSAANAGEAAIEFANHLNKTSLRTWFEFYHDENNDAVYVVARNGSTLYEVTAGGTLGSGAVSLTLNDTALGTVISVDVDNNKVTLGSTLTASVFQGAYVGVKVSRIKGMYYPEVDLDLTDRPQYSHGLATEGTVSLSNVPYFDSSFFNDLKNLTVG